MVKSGSKAYKVVVDNGEARATLICVTYKIGFSEPHYGAEFFELVTSFDNSKLKIPFGSYTFSFGESLRIFSTAALIAPMNLEGIENWIDAKMKEAYGTNCKTSVTNFPTGI